MRSADKRFKVKKLFVFGAGASYAATSPSMKPKSGPPPMKQTPLDKDFPKALLNLKRKKPLWINKSLDAMRSSWKDQKSFDHPDFGLESAIITHAANMKFGDAIHPSRTRKENRITFEVYLRHAAHLMAYRLRNAEEGRAGLYTKIAQKFFKIRGRGRRGKNNRIITFNYDDVFDNILMDKCGHNLADMYFQDIYPKKPKSDDEHCLAGSDFPVMAKLHGSVNWNCSSKKFENILRGNVNTSEEDWNKIVKELKNPDSNKYAKIIEELKAKSQKLGPVWYKEKGCPSCDDDSAPCIIPPIEAKPITEISLFKELWTTAREYLLECEELYVCGYSFPPTDALAHSLFKGLSNKKLKQVAVIDPDPSIMKEWMGLLSKNCAPNLTWIYYNDFKQFADSL